VEIWYIQSATTENSRGEKEERKKEEDRTSAAKYNVLPYLATIINEDMMMMMIYRSYI